jgi:acyl-CoA thioester hydrolase
MTTRRDELLPTPLAAAPTSGATRLRVRYGECDPMGVAHHAAYAPWLEMARTEMLRATGVTYAHMERAGAFLVVARMEISYRRPIYYDDDVEVRATVSGGSRVKIEHRYEIVLAEPGARVSGPRLIGEVLTTAATTLVCVDAQGRVRPLPDWLIAEGTGEGR